MQELADHLGLSIEETEKRWTNAKLSGDERYSIAHIFGFAYDGDGAVGTRSLEKGLAKLSKSPPKKTTKKKVVNRGK